MAKPEKKFQHGGVSASIFVNELSVNGQVVEKMTVSPQRSYKDKNDEWQTSTSFGINDIPKLIVALSKAYDYLTTRSEAE